MSNDIEQLLPTNLRSFLFSCIHSVEQVEVLILLRGSAKEYTARELATLLRASPPTIRRDLDTLTARGLLKARVAPETTFSYQPTSPELARYGDLLAEYYISARAAIFTFVSNQSRTSLQHFSDAFKLRDVKD
jgi:predicted ArsR family transcriptional regulator